MKKIPLCGLTAGEIYDLISTGGFTYKHALSISNCLYKKSITGFNNVNSLPLSLRRYLDETTEVGILVPVSFEVSEDKSVKYLFRNKENNLFETVFIPENKRNTVCVSTQSGCRMGCPFCITSRYGFHGNLSAGEIISQVKGLPFADKVTHVVFMGMGEPLDNIDNVMKACTILTSEWGLSLSARNVTVSTVGITSGIDEFLAGSECNLTLSLFSPFSDEREAVVPAEEKNKALDIIEKMKAFPLRKKRRLSIAYMMISNVNDSDRHLEELKRLMSGSGIRVNLVPFNSSKNDLLKAPSHERIQFFKHYLVVSGISASVRKSRGADISAACGQLAGGL